MELLYRRDVLPQENSPNFDPQKQRAIQVVPTSDPSQDQTVEKILKRGFSRAGRTLRAEEVVVHRYQEARSDTGETS